MLSASIGTLDIGLRAGKILQSRQNFCLLAGEGWFTVSEDQSGTKCLHYQLAYPYLQIKPTHISK